MTLPLARSTWECHAFFGLSRCPNCGGGGLEMTEHVLRRTPAGDVSDYTTACRRCDQTLRFSFRRADDEPPFPAFGGEQPSELLDAGQYLELAEEAAGDVPDDPADIRPVEPDDLTLEDAFEEIAIAVAALEETLKFIPPGEFTVARDALWTEESRDRFDRDPETFQRRRLIAVLGGYREIYAAYARAAR
ncbi:MAG: hypothetical protein HOV79_05465 [Hamadaea sp.]|nr:hypothetical protein [Hamadaea sp.]